MPRNRSDNVRAVEVDGRPITIQRLRSLRYCRVHQDGQTEATFHFDVADFEAVAAIVLPRLKRHISDANKQAARERMLAWHAATPTRLSPERLAVGQDASKSKT